MRLDNTKIIRSIEDLLDTFDVFADKYQNITFYCRDLNHFHDTNILNGDALYNKTIARLYNHKKANKNVLIKTYKYLEKSNLFKSEKAVNATNKITIKDIDIDVEVLSKEQDVIAEFVKELIELANNGRSKDNKIKNFDDASSQLVSNYKNIETNFEAILDKLKNSLINKTNTILSRENFDKRDETVKAIEESFKNIKENLKKASEDGNKYILKEITKFLIDLVDISDIKGSFKPLALLLAAPEAITTTTNIIDFLNKRGFYAFSGPAASLLATKFGFILGLLNTVSFNNILVFTNGNEKSGKFIDFSCFDITATKAKSNYDEYIGICSDFILEGDEQSLFDARVSKNENVDKSKNISICKNDKDNSEESLLERIKECVIANRANFVYMQYPFFNSFKFANLLKDKSLTTKDDTHNTNNSSGISKNYLVVSNAPMKLNAKLNEHLIQNILSYKIEDSINRVSGKKIVDPKNVGNVKDYSHYSIQIDAKKDEDLYLLSLSPFTRVIKSRLAKFEKDIEEYNSYMKGVKNFKGIDAKSVEALNTTFNEKYKKFNEANLYLGRINRHFKNAKNMEEIVNNEEEFLKANIKEFEIFFSSLNSNLKHDKVAYFLNQYFKMPNEGMESFEALADESNNQTSIRTHYYYPATKIFLLVMGYYVIRQIFDSSIIEQKGLEFSYLSSNYEVLEIFGETLNVLCENTYYVQENDAIVPIYFFKQTKEAKKQQDAICIEEIVEKIEQSHVRTGENILDDDSYNELKELLKNSTGIDGESIDDKNFEKYIKQIDDDEYKYTIDLSLTSTLDDALYDIFPFYGFFIDKSDDIMKKVIDAVFSGGKGNIFKNIFMELIGELKVFSMLGEAPVAKLVHENNKKALKKLKQTAFAGVVKVKGNQLLYIYVEHKKKSNHKIKKTKQWIDEFDVGINVKRQIAISAGKNFLKNSLKAYAETLIQAGFGFLVDSFFINNYEQQKRSYELILHKYFTNKFDDTYAVKNISYEPNSTKTNEYTYYPIEIYSSFINIDLKRTIIGGRLSSGGLDYHNFFYYDINTTTNKLDSNLSKDISLDTMISYLCLDELRTDNKTDEEFFNNLNKRNKKLAYSPKELMLQGVKTLLTISPSNPIDIKQRDEIYEMYKANKSTSKQALPIDKYNEAMEILEDFKNGNLNTNVCEVDNKSRRLLKALDVIGNNNVKGMYVGCKESWKEKENLEEKNIPPRLIGRLATTIVMEDGLYIG